MQELPSWRVLLGQLIHDPQERNRIANELGINPATLVRWAHNETNPRPQNLDPASQSRRYRQSPKIAGINS